jgi:tetratricopeptide (TPR) repeat protein
MPRSSRNYEAFRKLTTLIGLPAKRAVSQIGTFVDGAVDIGSIDDLSHVIRLATDLHATTIPGTAKAELSYFLANAWAGMRTLVRGDQAARWKWKQTEFEKELYYLRLAAHSDAFKSLIPIRRAQILTNTGNLLNHIGRSLEAIELYEAAMNIVPEFGMAMANRGLALKSLAHSHYDTGQAHLLMHAAWKALVNAPTSQIDPAARKFFKASAQQIEQWLCKDFLEAEQPTPRIGLGRTANERRYREWALQNKLFLNPLIALGALPVAARDTLNLPGIVVSINEGPGLLGIFNQIKQEFVSARFLLWEAVTSSRSHFSDRETHLIDTLDYPSYGIAVEKARLAFRMSYSILDKCAFLLNKHLKLGISDRAINLNRLWFNAGDPRKGFNPALVDTDNWPLRGLFWLARDLYDDDGFVDALEPQAKELKAIRDHLEHKYLKVHEIVRSVAAPSFLDDQYATSISRTSFEAKAMTIMKLARAAVTYLSLGIHSDERKRAKVRPDSEIVPPMVLPKIIEAGRR